MAFICVNCRYEGVKSMSLKEWIGLYCIIESVLGAVSWIMTCDDIPRKELIIDFLIWSGLVAVLLLGMYLIL